MTKEEMNRREGAYFAEYLEGVYKENGAERLNHFEHNLQVFC